MPTLRAQSARYKAKVKSFVRKVGKEGRKRKPKIMEEIRLLLYNDLKDLNKTLASMYNI